MIDHARAVIGSGPKVVGQRRTVVGHASRVAGQGRTVNDDDRGFIVQDGRAIGHCFAVADPVHPVDDQAGGVDGQTRAFIGNSCSAYDS